MTWFMEILKICLEKKLLIKVLCDDAFNIAKNPRYDRYQRGLTLMVYKFFDKKTVGGAVKNEIMQNKELADRLNKPIIMYNIFYRQYLGSWFSWYAVIKQIW